jgi:signal transduction histidine kinase
MINRLPPRIRTSIPEYSSLFLVLAMCTLGWLDWEHRQTVNVVTRTVAVETSIAEVLAKIQDAEDGVHGYVIKGDRKYLKNYYTAAATISDSVEKLAAISSDSPTQQAALVDLRPAIAARFSLLSKAIQERSTSSAEATLSALESDEQFAIKEKIRKSIDGMKDVESKLFADRVENVRRSTFFAVTAAIINLMLIGAAMYAWVWSTRNEARNLVATMKEREENEATIRQMQKIEAVGQLTGGLAHDLNNMLAVIISGLNLTQKRIASGNTNVTKFIDAAMDGATRAATLTNRLMAFSRQLPLKPETIEANKIVGGMSDLLQRTLGETIRIETVLNAGLWRTNADAGQLENALLNLSINARDAMPKGGKLTIETSNAAVDEAYARHNDMPPGDYVLTSVTDTGTGMTADVISKAFDPFFTTKGVGKGTGLGLSQVFGFMKQSGGLVKIYTELGHGTTIKMYLPRLIDTGPEQAIRTAKEEAWPTLKRDHAAQIVLVVEDDARVREMTVSSLRELGYTVIHADGATNALIKLDSHPSTTLLFTDIVMPEINGRQLAAEALRRRPDLKVLYTTGFTRNAIVHSGKLDAGLNFLAKPFTLVQLNSKMTEVLG